MTKKKDMSQTKTPEKRKTDQAQRGVKSITVGGFKSIRDEQTIEIRPLTILAGANSSGKSSMMQPLLLMKQTLDASYDPGPLLLDGPNVRFSRASQLFSYADEESTHPSVRVGMRLFPDWALSISYGPAKDFRGMNIAKMSFGQEREPEQFTLEPHMKHSALVRLLPKTRQEWLKKMFEEVGGTLFVEQERCFLTCGVTLLGETSPWTASQLETVIAAEIPSVWILFGNYLQEMIHVPGLRGMPERLYPTTAVGPAFQGTFDKYAASVIAEWQEVSTRRMSDLKRFLHDFGLASSVEARQVTDTHVELLVSRTTSRDRYSRSEMVSVADVGVGVSQVIPILVALLAAKKGQMVFIEQPELHLHPRAQVKLASILAKAAKGGVRVVIETHSSLLLLAIQTLVAEGELSPDLVKLHWFTRNEKGYTEVSSADLDESGAFGDWPEDFGDVELKAQSRYLDAAEKRQFGM
jgi:predicted ATPase